MPRPHLEFGEQVPDLEIKEESENALDDQLENHGDTLRVVERCEKDTEWK